MRRTARRLAVAVAALVLAAAPAAWASFDSHAAESANVGTATLAPASTLAATPGACTLGAPRVSLSWTASPSPWAAGYEILRSVTTDGVYVVVAVVLGASTTTHQDGAVLPSTTYRYAVRAIKGSWRSDLSNEAAITTASSLCT